MVGRFVAIALLIAASAGMFQPQPSFTVRYIAVCAMLFLAMIVMITSAAKGVAQRSHCSACGRPMRDVGAGLECIAPEHSAAARSQIA